jgi:hypothetical protein
LFISRQVEEAFPLSAGAQIPAEMTQEQVEQEMEKAAGAPPVTASEEMPASSKPAVISQGSFRDADSFHRGSGTATLYLLDDGSHLLRLENLDVTNGPDLHVLLVPAADPTERADIEGYVDLGPLKGNQGNQNYEIPTEVDPTAYGSIVIYCQPFHVIFSVASLK